MRQEINLYGPEFRRLDQPLSSKQILRGGLGFFLVLMLVQAIVGWQYYDNSQRKLVVEQEHRAVSERLARLKQSQPLSQRTRLEAQVENLSRQLKRLEELRAIIGGQNLGNSNGFSHYLNAMARQTVADVALTQIYLLRGGAYLELAGRSTKSESVPLYLQRLRKEPSFDAVRFGVLKIEGDLEGAGQTFQLGKAEERK